MGLTSLCFSYSLLMPSSSFFLLLADNSNRLLLDFKCCLSEVLKYVAGI